MKVRLPAGASRVKRERAPTRRETTRCPTCGSARLEPELAFIAGARYFCKDCGFRGALVISGLRQDDPPPKREGGAP